jgi:sugar/nucleoside kinase (ribokinase family)
MSAPARPPAGAGLQYVTVGHVTVDVLSDGSSRPGGSAFYSALQAARLGASARILTRGDPGEIEQLLAPFAGEVDVEVQVADRTTSLATEGTGAERRQRMLAWAGEITPRPVDGDIVHLAPVAAELGAGWAQRAPFVGLTAQGLVRSWEGPGAEVVLAPCSPALAALGEASDALVVSAVERAPCEAIVSRALAGGACVAVTAGASPTRLLYGDTEVDVPSTRAAAIDDLGAGDVFAAALFVSLAQGSEPLAAVRFAHAAASVRVRGIGAEAIGDRAAVDAELRA